MALILTQILIAKKGNIQTSLNMGYYDIVNNMPIDITFNGAGSKNNEVGRAQEWINNNNLQKTIFVCDRAYFKYDFFKYLIDNNLNFIIRIKENSDLKDTIKYIKDNCRLIEYNVTHIKSVIDKKNKKRNLECSNSYTLITNIPESDKLFTDDCIKDIYKNRWLIEVFFKHLKYNFNFEHFKEKQDTQYKKTIFCGLIVIYIAKLIKKYGLEDNNLKNKSINESNLVKGIYEKLLKHIINDTLTDTIVTNFIKSYTVPIINKKNRSFDRISNKLHLLTIH